MISTSPLGGDAPSPLENPDGTLSRSVEEAMAADWMGSYEQEDGNGDGVTSPLLTPTGLQMQIADVF